MSFAIVAGVGAAVSAGMGIAKAIKGSADKRKAQKANDEAKAQMERDRENYMKNKDTSNPYLNMENTMEDLTVNTQAADFAAEQNQIGMATTLGNMNQAAGGSGIAALAQALANQGQIANQKASISIAEQEKANQTKERQQAAQIQSAERGGQKLSRDMQNDLLAEQIQWSAGDVKTSSADINRAQQSIESGINQVGSAVGTFAGGIG